MYEFMIGLLLGAIICYSMTPEQIDVKVEDDLQKIYIKYNEERCENVEVYDEVNNSIGNHTRIF